MNRSILLATILAAAGCATSPVDSSSTATQSVTADLCPANTPASLAPAADQDLAFALAATGVQKYTCNGTAWVFVAPDAWLHPLHDLDEVVGHHYAGPTWEYEDGSTVVAAKAAGALVDPASIPWLLLVAKSHNAIDGRMSNVTAIQRLSTSGGNAPATGCDADHAGATADVPYTATYFFYRTHDGNNNVRCGG